MIKPKHQFGVTVVTVPDKHPPSKGSGSNGRPGGVKPENRFTPSNPCPVCGGDSHGRRGIGQRCTGFLSDSGEYALCSREEHSGGLPGKGNPVTYGHKLKGSCKCGVEHAPADPKPPRPRFKGKGGTTVAVYRYEEPDGTLRYEVLRKKPKAFLQRRPDPDFPGVHIWGIKGIERLPFHLPQLLAADPKEIVFKVEGEKCVLRLESRGLVATCNSGGAGEGWQAECSPWLKDRNVVILPDNDDDGRKHAQQTARALHGFASSIKVVELPDLPPKGDVVDWFGSGRSVDEILLLVEQAPEWKLAAAPAGEPAKISPNESVDDPSRLARLHLDQKHHHPDGLTLRFWQGEFHEWNGAYRPVLIDDLRARVSGTIKVEFDRINIEEIAGHAGDKPPPKARKVTGSTVANSILSLGSYAHLEPSAKSPCWLMDKPPFPACDVLPTRNALVNLPGLVNGDANAIHPPTPRFFCPYRLDYDFDAKAQAPANWLGFLNSLWGDDIASIQALQEWFGYLLTPDTRLQKILMLIGPRRSGKGTVARIMKAMIGSENVANPTLSSLGTNFGLAPLIGKPAATITDARLSGRADIAQVVERLLSISGEDGQTIDRKHLPAVTVKLPTRFTMLSNELPRLADTSGAMAGRLVILKMTERFYVREDTGLEGRIMPELPGILLWAIEGWKRLRERGKFVQPQSAAQLVEEMEDLASPAGMFVKEKCHVDPSQEVPVKTLFEAWREWCKEKNREHVGDESSFGRNLRAVMPSLVTKPVKSGGVYSRNFVGINLRISF